MAGEDCMCVMPTGGGKSLCYQLPAVARPGVTLVISPLIALMKDQVDGLAKLGIGASFVNSSLPFEEQRDRLRRLAAGEYDLFYVAPERLRNAGFLAAIRDVKLQLLAVDEAHCISQWGHDFRPDYARLGQFRMRLGSPQTIALTATATPQVRDDISKQLGLDEPKIFVSGFARQNLRFEVSDVPSGTEKDRELVDFLGSNPGAGIIYCSTRKRCEEVVEMLSARIKRAVALYHAGLMQDERRRVQESFMSGRTPIVAATNAFGMGIDKANLRFVIHYNMPGSLEAYYQEAGRAGRDGDESRCLLLYSGSDRHIQEYFIENSYPSREIVRKVYDYLRSIQQDPIELTLAEIKERLELQIGPDGVSVCEQLLEKAAAIERLDSAQNQASLRIVSELPTLVDLVPKEAKVRRRVLQAAEKIVGDLRSERVYFPPRQLATLAELEWDSVARALRELNKLEAFDYVPPFRGRAIHMLTRDPFHTLDIDFAEMERRKAAEYAKLQRVVQFATTRGCRQLAITRYFGDSSRDACRICDNCEAASSVEDDGEPASSADPNVTMAVRIVLSGVARIEQRFGERLRFGKQTIAQMLCGSRSARMEKWDLHKLSTFGLLSQLRQTEVTQLIDALQVTNLLEQQAVERNRPIIRLTEEGRDAMKGTSERPLALEIPKALRTRLSALRLPGSEPTSEADVRSDEGQGTRIQEDRLSSSLEPQSEESSALDRQSMGRAPDGEQAETCPAYYWTWQLLADGYTPIECAQIRGLSLGGILDHLMLAVDAGREVDLSWVLTKEQQERLSRIAPSGSDRVLRELTAELPDLIPEQILLYTKLRPGVPGE